ncbi:large subunit ribosomal protein L27Ae [Angomonas deanei]|nr:large subunit ribosomal protein L27Ae [Angomonas deanei]|eukprot:EPY36694.1 large subunit ribosomal protein L27Ae [Angomonas deanei]
MKCSTKNNLSLENNSATGLADLLVGELADVASLHDAGHLDVAVAEKLGVALGLEVYHGKGGTLLRAGNLVAGEQTGQVVQVDRGLPVLVLPQVVVLHTELTKVPGMVLIEVDTVVVLTAGVTTTRLMLTVLTDATITVEGRTAVVAALLKAGRHMSNLEIQNERGSGRERLDFNQNGKKLSTKGERNGHTRERGIVPTQGTQGIGRP